MDVLHFLTDHVFGTSATTGTIFSMLAKPIVEGVMEGINGTMMYTTNLTMKLLCKHYLTKQ